MLRKKNCKLIKHVIFYSILFTSRSLRLLGIYEIAQVLKQLAIYVLPMCSQLVDYTGIIVIVQTKHRYLQNKC
jgi:hypothetical protein